ncbi:outer membrane beta-barrel protein [Flavobacterium suzhouense]|uniref:Outer membrane beta-barrel protein n=1 Tax=Flavobacterium suzhouense TaxID=1529638 RepID=A0ABW5NR76_9FLAO
MLNTSKFLLVICLYSFVSLYSQEKKSSVSLTGYYVDFDDYLSGFGYNIGYQYKLTGYLLLEASLTHVSGSDFPNDFTYNTASNNNEDKWYTKTAMTTAGTNLHLTFVNEGHNYLSFYTGIGCLWLDGTDFVQIKIPAFIDGQDVTIVSSEMLSKKSSYLSRTIGLRYKYKLNNNFSVGIDLNITQTFKGKNNYILPDNFRAIGLTLSKSF